MRILRVAQKLYPETKGGGAYHAHAMSRDQAEMGHDVTVLTVGESGIEQREGYSIIRRPAPFSILGNDIAPGLWREMRRATEYDVVHAHSHLYFATNVAALRRRIGMPKLALTNHGLYSQTAPEQVFRAYLHTMGKWTFNAADLVFCYTEVERNRLRQLGVDSEIDVVPNGIDQNEFTPGGPESGLVDHDGPVVLFVGRLVEGKRPRNVVDIMERLPSELGARLFICGDGPLREPLERRVDNRGLEKSVIFLGHLNYGEMAEVYRAADVMILPSMNEGFPRTVLESLASGTPVITSDLPQLESLVSEAGEFVPTGDIEGFAEALRKLLEDDKHRVRLAERGQCLVEDEYSWSKTVEHATAALEELVEKND